MNKGFYSFMSYLYVSLCYFQNCLLNGGLKPISLYDFNNPSLKAGVKNIWKVMSGFSPLTVEYHSTGIHFKQTGFETFILLPESVSKPVSLSLLKITISSLF